MIINPFRKFIECIWPSGFVRKQIETKARTTAGIYKISQADVRFFILPLPPLAEQEQIVAEVEANLTNIAKLEEVTENSLKRAEHERQSILREAFAGRLVPQDPDDEPASVLLERIREERKKREEADKVSKVSRKGTKMGIAKRRRDKSAGDGQQEVGLYEKLVEVGQPLPPDDLFKRVGLKTEEQPESVEVFYKELHVDITADLIEVERPATDRVLLHAVEQDNEDLGEDEEPGESGTLPADDMWQPGEMPLSHLEEATEDETRKARKEENRPSLWDE